MFKPKQKLKELFSFLWNEFPKRYSSRALFVYTIVTTIIVWGPLFFLFFLQAIKHPEGSGTGGDGLILSSMYALFASVVFNLFFGIFFYILLYFENKYKDFRLKLKKDPVSKFYRIVLSFIFLIFVFSFVISTFDILYSLFTNNIEKIVESVEIILQCLHGIFFEIFLGILSFFKI